MRALNLEKENGMKKNKEMVGIIMMGVASYIFLYSSNFQSTNLVDYAKNILSFLLLILGILIFNAEKVSVEEFYEEEKEKIELETEISFIEKRKI